MRRLRTTIIVEYDADPMAYGGPDVTVEEMVALDQANWDDDPASLLHMGGDISIKVEPASVSVSEGEDQHGS